MTSSTTVHDVIIIGGPKPEEGDGVRATATWPGTE